MIQATQTAVKVWRYGGLVLFFVLTHDKGFFWMGTGAVIYALVYGALVGALVLATPAPSQEEEARKNTEWLNQIDRDYKKIRSVEDRLDELERLKRRDMVTPEEYATKRQEILKDL